PINESAIIGRPVGCTISFRSRFIHFEIIGLNKPYRLGLCNKASGFYKNLTPFSGLSEQLFIYFPHNSTDPIWCGELYGLKRRYSWKAS
ncbi:hypothetical protein OLN40_18885, partial [Acinetobacter baumannii]|nr:hypothetical protein [Acinetobacter baumannii]